MKHFNVWLSLVGGTTFGLLFGYYLGHGLRDATPDTRPVGVSESEAVSFSTWRAGGGSDLELGSSIDNETRIAGGRIESLSESIDRALRLPTPADEVQLLMLLQSLRKEDFPIFLKMLRETRSTMSLHSSKVGGAVVWATFWQKFGAVDPQAAVVSAVSCQNLNYEGRHLLEKHLFSSIGQTDPTLAAQTLS